jgi:hypothetical protein
VQTFFRIELRQTYHRDVSGEQGGASYFFSFGAAIQLQN